MDFDLVITGGIIVRLSCYMSMIVHNPNIRKGHSQRGST